jgi:NADPH:quinone reductase-like Zn-dependent oxidoreductase
MKAIVCTTYGPPDVLQIREVEKPTPKEDELLVKVHATTVTSGDWPRRKGDSLIVRFISGLMKPNTNEYTGV